MLFLRIDLKQGEILAKYLSSDLVSRKETLTRSVELITCLTHQQSYPDSLKHYISLIETEYRLSRCAMTDFLSKVPPNFLRFYRSGLLSVVVFSRFFSNTTTLPLFVENPTRESITQCSKGLRYLQYSLLLAFIKRCSCEIRHLSECNPVVSEVSRSTDASSFRRCSITLEPSFAIPGSDVNSCISFIQANFTSCIKCTDNWMEMLALILSLWHVSTHPDVVFNILDHPTALAIALIVCSVETSGGGLNASNLNELADSMHCTYSIDVVHEINELQLLYISLIFILRFVGVISACEGANNENLKTRRILEAERIFPCSRLIHNFAVALASSSDRKSLGIWLAKLLTPTHNNDYVEKAHLNMVYFMRVLCEMRAVRPIEFTSKCEECPFPDFDDRRGKTVPLSPQQALPLGRRSDLKSDQSSRYPTHSAFQQACGSQANGSALARNSQNKSCNDGQFSNEITTKFMPRNTNQVFPTWNKGDSDRTLEPNGSFVQTRTVADDKSGNLNNSTNPFLPGYNPASVSNHSSPFTKALEPQNPSLSDFDVNEQRCVSECGEKQDRIGYPYFQDRRGFRVGQRRGMPPRCGNSFASPRGQIDSSRFARNHTKDGDPKALTRVKPWGDSDSRSQVNGNTSSNLRRGRSEGGSNSSFNRKYPLMEFGNSRARQGNPFRPSRGLPRRGGAHSVNSDKNGNLSKCEWNLKGIEKEFEKMCLDFS